LLLVTERAEREISRDRLVEDDVAALHRARVLGRLGELGCRRGTLDESEPTLRPGDQALAELGDRGVVPLLVAGVGRAVELARRQARDGGALQQPAQAKLAVLRVLQTTLSSRQSAARRLLGVGSRSASLLSDTGIARPQASRPFHAAGMMMRLALENAELNVALRESRRELVDARARITRVSDQARRTLERDLHDGAQQRLTAIAIRLGLAQDRVLDQDLARQLESIRADLELAADELQDLARGIYPALLSDRGLADAVRSLAIRAPLPVSVIDEGIGRWSAEVEAAVYFCTLEAVQNAIKHAGGDARVTVVLRRGPSGDVQFEVTDDGVGITMPIRPAGVGLISMRDRIGAVGGELDIISARGRGTSVRGTVPDDRHRQAQAVPVRLPDGGRGSSARPHRPRRDRALM
jgi:signal transduction histidine kinase